MHKARRVTEQSFPSIIYDTLCSKPLLDFCPFKSSPVPKLDGAFHFFTLCWGRPSQHPVAVRIIDVWNIPIALSRHSFWCSILPSEWR